MTATSVLALDLAKRTGYAQWAPGEATARAGTFDTVQSENVGVRLASVYKWLLKRTKDWAVTDIAVETPITAQMPGTAEKAIWLISVFGMVKMLGAQTSIHVEPIANVTLAIHWLGSRDIEKKLRKTYSVLEAQRRGFKHITEHDTADALGLLSLRCSMLGLTPPWDFRRSPGPLFTGVPQPAGTRITKGNERAAAIITNRALSFDREETS